MAKRARAITYGVDCPNKKITLTWKVLIAGKDSNDTRADEVERIFRTRFGLEFPPMPQGSWKLGTCKVYFKLDATRAVGRTPTKDERDGDRDLIEMNGEKPGGGGAQVDVDTAKAPAMLLQPDSDTGGMSEWKTAHELGHGLGIDDPAGGKWLTDRPPTDKIQDKHIEELLNKAPADIKKKINECCGSHLTAALAKPVQFPKKEFAASDPRDELFKIFPPGSENPFTPKYEREMVDWQKLVRRDGLTEAYRQWLRDHPRDLRVETQITTPHRGAKGRPKSIGRSTSAADRRKR